MTAELVSLPTRSTAGFAARASQHRRHQVRSRASASSTRLHELWTSVADVLDAVPGHAGAVLCTMDGTPVAVHGVSRGDQLRLPREARRLIATRRADAELDRSASGVVTAELVVGLRCTVVAQVPSAEHGDLLLVVTAVEVSAPLLLAWTSRAAEDLRELVSVAE